MRTDRCFFKELRFLRLPTLVKLKMFLSQRPIVRWAMTCCLS